MRLPFRLNHWVAAVLLSSALSSCAYIIPPSPNEPRNNEVRGDMRKPVNNPAPGSRRSAVSPTMTPVAAPVAQVAQAPLPPVDTSTQQRAQDLSSDPSRRPPVENAQFQMSSNGYPPIYSVPAAPAMSGPNSAQSRLSATQAELERDRSNAYNAAEKLGRDAAAEPSMLMGLPKIDGVVPANDPIQVTPVSPQGPRSSLSPLDAAYGNQYASYPPPGDPMALSPMVRAGDFNPLATADGAPAATAPVAATPRGAMSSSYVSNRYIPPSRYSEVRY